MTIELIKDERVAVMPLPFGFSTRYIAAGPFREAPTDGYFLVKLDQHQPRTANVTVPIRDFGVPNDTNMVLGALKTILQVVADRGRVYVGCGAGMGRTGLLLALLVKMMAPVNPVKYVRDKYNTRAIETQEQEFYIHSFDVTDLQFFTFRMECRALWADVKHRIRR